MSDSESRIFLAHTRNKTEKYACIVNCKVVLIFTYLVLFWGLKKI